MVVERRRCEMVSRGLGLLAIAMGQQCRLFVKAVGMT
jgi:hypothetical protein